MSQSDLLAALNGLVREHRVDDAANRALAILSTPDRRCRLIVADRLYPDAAPCALSDTTRARLAAGDRVTLASSELAVDGDDTLQAQQLAPDTILLCAGDSPASSERQTLEQLVGRLLHNAVRGARDLDSAETAAETARLAEFGAMSKKLNHDLRNPLCALSLNVHLLSMAAKNADEKILERIRSLEECAVKINDIVEQLGKVKRAALGAGA